MEKDNLCSIKSYSPINEREKKQIVNIYALITFKKDEDIQTKIYFAIFISVQMDMIL
jgi:hypothetical protein